MKFFNPHALILSFILLFSSISSFSQSQILTTSFEYENSLFNYSLSVDENERYSITISKDGEEKKESFSLQPLNSKVFETGFASTLISLINYTGDRDAFVETMKPTMQSLFLQSIAASVDLPENAPIAGRISIAKKVVPTCFTVPWKDRKNYTKTLKLFKHHDDEGKSKKKANSASNANTNTQKKSIRKTNYTTCECSGDSLKVSNIQIEFSEGFIENISATLIDSKGIEIDFENNSSIGFSSKKDYEFLEREFLYGKYADKDCICAIRLSEFLKYKENYRNKTKKYNPSDQVIFFPEPEQKFKLYSDKTERILEAKIFSDAIGLIENNSPNGIVQTEIRKRFSAKTRRPFLFKDYNFGFFNSFDLHFRLTELKESNRYAAIQSNSFINADSNAIITPPGGINPLDNFRYQPLNVGISINTFSLANDPAGLKYNIRLNGEIGTSIARDSAEILNPDKTIVKTGEFNEFRYANASISTEFEVEYFPDERIGMNGGIQLGFTNPTHPNIANVFSDKSIRFLDQVYLRLGLDAYIDLNPGESQNRIFFRYRFFSLFDESKDVFQQMQIGYSFYLTRNRRLTTSRNKK